MTKQSLLSASRKFPRKVFKRKLTFLCRGKATVVDGVEIGEGGISFKSDYILDENQKVIVNFFISEGDFFSVKTTLMNKQVVADQFVYGVVFDDISIALKRQIRAYVARKSTNQFDL